MELHKGQHHTEVNIAWQLERWKNTPFIPVFSPEHYTIRECYASPTMYGLPLYVIPSGSATPHPQCTDYHCTLYHQGVLHLTQNVRTTTVRYTNRECYTSPTMYGLPLYVIPSGNAMPHPQGTDYHCMLYHQGVLHLTHKVRTTTVRYAIRECYTSPTMYGLPLYVIPSGSAIPHPKCTDYHCTLYQQGVLHLTHNVRTTTVRYTIRKCYASPTRYGLPLYVIPSGSATPHPQGMDYHCTLCHQGVLHLTHKVRTTTVRYAIRECYTSPTRYGLPLYVIPTGSATPHPQGTDYHCTLYHQGVLHLTHKVRTTTVRYTIRECYTSPTMYGLPLYVMPSGSATPHPQCTDYHCTLCHQGVLHLTHNVRTTTVRYTIRECYTSPTLYGLPLYVIPSGSATPHPQCTDYHCTLCHQGVLHLTHKLRTTTVRYTIRECYTSLTRCGLPLYVIPSGSATPHPQGTDYHCTLYHQGVLHITHKVWTTTVCYTIRECYTSPTMYGLPLYVIPSGSATPHPQGTDYHCTLYHQGVLHLTQMYGLPLYVIPTGSATPHPQCTDYHCTLYHQGVLHLTQMYGLPLYVIPTGSATPHPQGMDYHCTLCHQGVLHLTHKVRTTTVRYTIRECYTSPTRYGLPLYVIPSGSAIPHPQCTDYHCTLCHQGVLHLTHKVRTTTVRYTIRECYTSPTRYGLPLYVMPSGSATPHPQGTDYHCTLYHQGVLHLTHKVWTTTVRYTIRECYTSPTIYGLPLYVMPPGSATPHPQCTDYHCTLCHQGVLHLTHNVRTTTVRYTIRECYTSPTRYGLPLYVIPSGSATPHPQGADYSGTSEIGTPRGNGFCPL